MSKPTREDMILANGRQFAGDILNQAVATAKSADQLNGQLQVIDTMAVHVLATNIFNRIKHMGANETHLVMETKELIEDELKILFEHESEMELIKPDSMKEETKS